MTPRSIRRAAERKARKLARKAEKANLHTAEPSVPVELPPAPADFSEICLPPRSANLPPVDPPRSNPMSANPTPADLPPISAARLAANRANAQHSRGPVTDAGKAVSCRNNFRHGLAGSFMILSWEKEEEFDELYENLRAEHQPTGPTEVLLVESMAQHYWLRQRAMKLQYLSFRSDAPMVLDQKEFALYLRYQTTHDRAFHKALNLLIQLKRNRAREQAASQIGFESQKHKRAAEERKQAAEQRKQSAEKRCEELHHFAVSLAEAKVDHQKVLTLGARMPQTITALAERAA